METIRGEHWNLIKGKVSSQSAEEGVVKIILTFLIHFLHNLIELPQQRAHSATETEFISKRYFSISMMFHQQERDQLQLFLRLMMGLRLYELFLH